MASHYNTLLRLAKKHLEVLKKLRVAVKELASKSELQALAKKLGVHADQVARYYLLWGDEDEVVRFFQAKPPPKSIRVNTLKTSVDELVERLSRKGVKLRRSDLVPYGLIVEECPYTSLAALHEYLKGMFHIQGLASMLVVPQLEPEKAEVVADLCCGAGGKSTQIAQHNPSSPVLAMDCNERKLLALKLHASRLGVYNVVAVKDDARRVYVYGPFDRVLIDAPCTGEGLRPFPGKAKPRSFEDVVSRVELQVELLVSALLALSRPGILVYATCSTAVEENELVISTVLKVFKNVEVVEPSIPVGERCIAEYGPLSFEGEVELCRRLYPHKQGLEGFTIYKLVLQ